MNAEHLEGGITQKFRYGIPKTVRKLSPHQLEFTFNLGEKIPPLEVEFYTEKAEKT